MTVDLDLIEVQADQLDAAAETMGYSAAKKELQAGADNRMARTASLRAHIAAIQNGSNETDISISSTG